MQVVQLNEIENIKYIIWCNGTEIFKFIKLVKDESSCQGYQKHFN